MKTLFFSLIVVISGYYLLSQTDSGHALLSKAMPNQQIEQTTAELLNKVDGRLQDFTNKQSKQQNLKIQQLEQQINDLSALLAKQQSVPQKTPNTAVTTDLKPTELNPQTTLKNLSLPPDLSEIKAQTTSYTSNSNTTIKTNQLRADMAAHESLQRQKQASLQDIATRMEQVSLTISQGNY